MDLDPPTESYPPKPLPNSYWVVPGRLLAGEYPGSRSAEQASNRLQSLLDAGLNAFIDLTELHELPPYRDLLAESDVRDVQYHRAAFPDHSVPDTAQSVVRVLDLIDRLLAEGCCIYVHCRAGIGRTGLIVGCHLARTGLTGEAALERLQILWRQCERSRTWPSIPETPAQVRFVRSWSESTAGTGMTLVQRCQGALLGLVIGDALGQLAGESDGNAAGTTLVLDGESPLQIGADSAMTLAVVESLLERQGYDPRDQLRRYQEWAQSASGVQLAPAELKRALATWKWSRKALAGSHDPKNVDSHTLARTLAPALYSLSQPAAAIELAVEVSRTTLQSPVVLDVCRLWAAALLDTLQGESKASVLSFSSPLLQMVRARNLRPELGALLSGEWSRVVGSSAQAVLAWALASLQSTQSFQAGVQQAVMTARQRPACGALYGAIAGALYGVQQIPEQWRARLMQEQSLLALAERLAAPLVAPPAP